MSKASLMQLVILTTIISLFANNVSSQPQPPPISITFQANPCNVNFSAEYSAGSPYETNLRTLLAALEHQANSTKFYSTSFGTAPDTVHGQYYCRGDISTTLCGVCVQKAVRASPCFPSKAGTVFISECTLRYSDQPLYGLVAELPNSVLPRGNVSDTQQSYAALTTSLTGLIAEAVNVDDNGGRPRLFATGNGSTSSTVYSLVQCSPDLSGTHCETCLNSIYYSLPMCCGQQPATWFSFYPSCLMMYSTEGLFYYDPPLAPPPLVASPPSPPPASPMLIGSPPPTPSTFSAPPPPINGGSEVVGSFRKKMGIAIAAFVILLIFI